MREGWAETTLGEIVSVERGYSYTSADLIENAVDTAQSCALFGLKAVGRNGGFREDGVRWLSAVPDARFVVNEGDLLVATTDLTRAREVLGSPILAPNFVASSSTVFSLDLVRLVVGQDVSSQEFLSEWLRWSRVREEVKALGTGTTVIHLNIKGFKRLKISVPPKPEQHRIVDLMRAVDEYITAADKRVETAKTARGALLADLLSNPGNDWTKTTLGEICKRNGGRIQTGPFGSQLHASDYEDVGTPVVMPTNIVDGRIDLGGIARIGESHLQALRRHVLQVGDIVYARRGDIEKCALITESEAGYVCGTGCLLVRVNSTIDESAMVARWLGTVAIRRWIRERAVGATMPNLNTSILSAVPIQLPDSDTYREIVLSLNSADELVRQALTVLGQSRRLRAALLSDLLSGSHQIPASYDRFLEAA